MDDWFSISFHCSWYSYRRHCCFLHANLGVINMLNRLMKINTSAPEFLYKFPLVLFIIMPVCMGGCFWVGMQVDSVFNIHFFKFIFPFLGTSIGLFLTILLILAGHKKQFYENEEAKVNSQLDTLPLAKLHNYPVGQIRF
jgi:hypothetical protein